MVCWLSPHGNDSLGVYYYARAVAPQGTKNCALTVLVHKWLFSQSSHCPEIYYYTKMVTPQETDYLEIYYYARMVTSQETKDSALTVVVHK